MIKYCENLHLNKIDLNMLYVAWAIMTKSVNVAFKNPFQTFLNINYILLIFLNRSYDSNFFSKLLVFPQYTTHSCSRSVAILTIAQGVFQMLNS